VIHRAAILREAPAGREVLRERREILAIAVDSAFRMRVPTGLPLDFKRVMRSSTRNPTDFVNTQELTHMIKRSIALAAITALSAGAAFAQSSVTVYGRLNTSAEQQKNIATDGTQSVLQNNASRLGFKGVEDLGGGLKAEFLLEHRFNSDTGTVTGDFYAGDAFVGISGGFGSIRAGRLTSAAYYATADWIGMHNHDTGTSEDKLYTYLSQNKNTISYTTPSFSGFTVEGSVSAGEGARAIDPPKDILPNKVWNLAGNYDGGALQLGLGYEQVDKTSDDQIAARAVYTMGNLTFGGYYQYSNIEGLGSRNLFRVAGMYAMGASEFHVNVGFADDWSSLNNSSANQYTVAYNYNLSKRTKIYAFYTTVDNSSAFSYFGATSKSGDALDPSSFAVGVRHNF
jgi:predicted porin